MSSVNARVSITQKVGDGGQRAHERGQSLHASKRASLRRRIERIEQNPFFAFQNGLFEVRREIHVLARDQNLEMKAFGFKCGFSKTTLQ